MDKSLKQAILSLLEVINDSDPDKEIVRIQVKEGGHTRGYAVVDNTFNADDEPSNEFRHIFIFPRIEVKTGDFIRVFTGEGEYNTITNKKDTITHKLYWNSDACVWNDKEGDEAILIRYGAVNKVVVPPHKKPGVKVKK